MEHADHPARRRDAQRTDGADDAGRRNEPRRRCGAAHRDDASLCEGDRKAVRIRVGDEEVTGCVNHGARLYASVEGAGVFPVGGPDGPHAAAADEVRRRATGMNPFFWMAGPEQPGRLTAPDAPSRRRPSSPLRTLLHRRASSSGSGFIDS